jgi:hypothetical protein
MDGESIKIIKTLNLAFAIIASVLLYSSIIFLLYIFSNSDSESYGPVFALMAVDKYLISSFVLFIITTLISLFFVITNKLDAKVKISLILIILPYIVVLIVLLFNLIINAL